MRLIQLALQQDVFVRLVEPDAAVPRHREKVGVRDSIGRWVLLEESATR